MAYLCNHTAASTSPLPLPCSIKLFTPGSATPEDYNGPRTAKALADAAVGACKFERAAVVANNGTASNICGCVSVCWLLPTDLQPALAPLHVCRIADQQACQAAEEPGLGACVGPVQPRHEGKLMLRCRRRLLLLLLLMLLLLPRQRHRQYASAAAAAAA